MGEEVVMGKIRQHFRENKKVYVAATGGLVAGAVGIVVFQKKADVVVSPKILQVLNYKPQAHLEVYIEALGDPGNIIQDLKTGTIYASQGRAAKELGLDPAALSKHLKGLTPHVKGHTFTKLGKAMVAE